MPFFVILKKDISINVKLTTIDNVHTNTIDANAHLALLKESDEALMLAYAQGDGAAFEQLYQRHKKVVYRFFIRQNLIPAPSVAEELMHDTWLKIINARESYQATALFKTYLFTVARRLLIDHREKMIHRQQESKESALEQENDTLVKRATENDSQTLHCAIKNQIYALPFEQREVFLLKQESGFTIEQIALITHQNKEKVKSQWRYALKKMREGLCNYGK